MYYNVVNNKGIGAKIMNVNKVTPFLQSPALHSFQA